MAIFSQINFGLSGGGGSTDFCASTPGPVAALGGPVYIYIYIYIYILYIFLSDEGPMLETLDHTIRIGSTPTFLYFDLYIYIT